MKKMILPIISIFGLRWFFNTRIRRNYPSEILFSEDNFTALMLIEESGHLKTNAYLDSKNIPTIGVGTTYIYSRSGRELHKVKLGDTLTSLRNKFGFSDISDFEFARLQCELFFKKSWHNKHLKRVFKDLNDAKVPYNDGLVFALFDFKYNSGSAFVKPPYNVFKFHFPIFSMFLGGSDFDNYLAKKYVQFRITYLKNHTSAYGTTSWFKRVAFCGDLIRGVKKPYLFYDNKSNSQIRQYIYETFGVQT